MTMTQRIDELVGGLEAVRSPDAPAATATSAVATAMVQLSYFAYDEPITDIPGDVADPDKVFPPVNDSYWRCVWGPVVDGDDGNLLYVAGLFAGSPDAPAGTSPFAVALVNRGTADPDVKGLLEDLYEDATPIPQDQWQDDPDAWVANGSRSAFRTVTGLTWGGQTVLDYLCALPQVDGHEPIILVTGHSLGGCIASMLAPWLVANLPPAKAAWLTPITFAGPTAGNQGFVDDLAAACPLRQIYVNPMDVVPMAWWEVGAIPDVYGLWYLDPVVASWAATTCLALDALDYPYVAVPSAIAPLPGKFIKLEHPIFGLEWFQEAGAQHACANYMLLMGLVPPYAFAPDAPRMQRLESAQREDVEAVARAGGRGTVQTQPNNVLARYRLPTLAR
ncbi:hypothetical protein E2493_17620 [Sphingomonas parva]|uniref:Fungal lipase-type domain-containing protein n=1 Tax=Sphingomonas parva TaxID=2555898 RepID=A0A4Y8ZLV4_9SPHN|nr:hypothetical protein [Sphingomonas parva]TFI56944.1 hypothetical protein E2493_17620 [Sphingomonas parva]